MILQHVHQTVSLVLYEWDMIEQQKFFWDNKTRKYSLLHHMITDHSEFSSQKVDQSQINLRLIFG